MLRSKTRAVIISLPILVLVACQLFSNPPGKLVLLTSTVTSTATATRMATPTFTAAFATIQPSNTPTAPTSTPQEGSPTPAFPDLNGVWDDNGYLIVIVQDGFSVSAAYIEERICDHADGTGATTPFRHDFDATLAQEGGVWTLSGEELTVCGFGHDDTSLNGIHSTSMKATISADSNTIAGDWYHFVEARWVFDGLKIVRQFRDGAPVPTPEGFTLPTAVP
jgi:hypothetical protein